MEAPLTLFVYGSLRRGCPNHHLLDGAEFIGTGAIEASFYVRDELVMAIEGPGTVYGEAYQLRDPNHLEALDRFERHPSWYARRPTVVTLEDGRRLDGWCYFKAEPDPEARLTDHGQYLRMTRNC